MREAYRPLRHAEKTSASRIIVHDRKDAVAMLGLVQLMKLFDSIDEHAIPCFNRQCQPSPEACLRLTAASVLQIHHDIERGMLDPPAAGTLEEMLYAEASPGSGDRTHGDLRRTLDSSQWADIFVLQQWIKTRLWVSCLTHGLLEAESDFAIMNATYPFTVARETLDECERLGQTCLEVHGIGMVSCSIRLFFMQRVTRW